MFYQTLSGPQLKVGSEPPEHRKLLSSHGEDWIIKYKKIIILNSNNVTKKEGIEKEEDKP